MPAVGDRIYTYWRVVDTTGAFVTGLTLADFTLALVKDGSPAAEAIVLIEIGDGVYAFRVVALSAGEYGLALSERTDTFANSAGASTTRAWTVQASADVTPYAVGGTLWAYWTVRDTNGDLVPGLTASDFRTKLAHNDASASETVSVIEVSPGNYAWHFTPTGQDWYGLSVQERTDTFANSRGLGFTGNDWLVGPAPQVDLAGCYCSLADIEGVAGETYSASGRTPTIAQITTFAQEIASSLTASMREVGFTATPADGGTPINTATQDGADLARMLREANALGAASKAKRAAFLGQPPSDSPVPDILWGQYLDRAGGWDPIKRVVVESAIQRFVRACFPVTAGSVGANSDQLAGQTAAPIATDAPQAPGLQFDMDFRN